MNDKEKAYKEMLADWRRKHFKELEINLKVWKSIRDDPEEKAKDRSEAAKNIARALSALAPEKVEKKVEKKKEESPFSPEEEDALNARLSATLGDKWISTKGDTSANSA